MINQYKYILKAFIDLINLNVFNLKLFPISSITASNPYDLSNPYQLPSNPYLAPTVSKLPNNS